MVNLENSKDAANELEKLGISCEVIDIQSIVPFDLNCEIVEPQKKPTDYLLLMRMFRRS